MTSLGLGFTYARRPTQVINTTTLISGMVVHIRPRDLASWSDSTQINDLSGNNYHVTQATGANQPNLTISAVKGNRMAVFDGTNDFMSFGTPVLGNTRLFADHTDEWTVFCCGRWRDVGYMLAKAQGATSSLRQFGFYRFSDDSLRCLVRGG